MNWNKNGKYAAAAAMENMGEKKYDTFHCQLLVKRRQKQNLYFLIVRFWFSMLPRLLLLAKVYYYFCLNTILVISDHKNDTIFELNRPTWNVVIQTWANVHFFLHFFVIYFHLNFRWCFETGEKYAKWIKRSAMWRNSSKKKEANMSQTNEQTFY